MYNVQLYGVLSSFAMGCQLSVLLEDVEESSGPVFREKSDCPAT
jgi:hypothetical protein